MPRVNDNPAARPQTTTNVDYCGLLWPIVVLERVTRQITLTRLELAFLEAAAARCGLSPEAFIERILRAYLANRK
jgi:hypothetical protein